MTADDRTNAGTQPTPATVERAAALARLELTAERRAELAQQCARILESFQSLAQLDVTGVAPMYSPSATRDVLRDDRERASLGTATVLANAPRAEGEFFSVPKTIGADA